MRVLFTSCFVGETCGVPPGPVHEADKLGGCKKARGKGGEVSTLYQIPLKVVWGYSRRTPNFGNAKVFHGVLAAGWVPGLRFQGPLVTLLRLCMPKATFSLHWLV